MNRRQVSPNTRNKNKGSHSRIQISSNERETMLVIDQRAVRLTNLQKVFWPDSGLTKSDLLRYYVDISRVLLPHLRDRAMVLKRYPNGISGEFFFMKRAPTPRPDWVRICRIKHSSGIIHFPVIEDLASLLWAVNLGCIDLNQWYSRCDDVDHPDYLHFDLDPVAETPFQKVLETALLVREGLTSLKMPCYVKTSGARGIHIYVPIKRGPTQKQVWEFAKAFAQSMTSNYPKLVTAEYSVEKRPRGHVLVDYNQNAWGRTLASVYSVRPKPRATVSTPVSWNEVEQGIKIEDFRMENVPNRIQRLGDLWKPLLGTRGRFRLERFF